jgi:hypothetical protein
MAEFVDWFIPLIGILLSAFVAYKFKLLGLIAGIAIFWFAIVLRLEALMYFDSSYSPGVLGAVQNSFGWVVGLVWCLMFFLVNLFKRRKSKAQSVVQSTT